jgi:hypothetical protein
MMPLVSVRAIYDGEHVELLEEAPVRGPYRVLVTFVSPVDEQPGADRQRFVDSYGAWVDDRPLDDTLSDICSARHSSADPPRM